MFQVSQIMIYPLCSAAFEVMNQWQRVAFVFCFPILKRGVRRIARLVVRQFSREFEDLTDEVSGIEICSSIYQVMIMQNSPTVLSTTLIIGVDVLQGMSTVLYFMDKSSVVPQRRIIASAVEILSRRAWSMDASSRTKTASSLKAVSHRRASTQVPATNTVGIAPIRPLPLMKSGSSVDSLRKTQSDDKIVVRHALEILHAAEVILMVEYLEIAIPMICTVFMVIASQFDSAKYNPRISAFYHHSDQVSSAVQSLMLYIVLHSLVLWQYTGSCGTGIAYQLRSYWHLCCSAMLVRSRARQWRSSPLCCISPCSITVRRQGAW